MAKKDINFIRHVGPQVKREEQRMRDTGRYIRRQKVIDEINIRTINAESKHIEVCKQAAKMSIEDRLRHYAVFGNPEYLGLGCKWDFLTRLGRKRDGGLL